MTAAVFLAAVALAWFHYDTRGVFLLPGTLTIYVGAFIVVLATACLSAILLGDRRARIAAVVLVVSFAFQHWAWGRPDPTLASGFVDLATAAFFVLFGATRWELSIAAVYILSAFSAVAVPLGFIDGYTDRAPVFIALTAHPDISSLLGHVASITLGAGAGDIGRRVRSALEVRPVFVAARRSAFARVAALAKVAARKAD